MARMYPTEGPREHDPLSQESDIYDALKKLPDDYVVIHSFRSRKIDKGQGRPDDKESDFVIYHRELGILCLEAKGGWDITFRDTCWYYTSGKKMDDPYTQAANAMYELVRKIKQERGIKACTILSAVWFPGMLRRKIEEKTFPAYALKEFTMANEDLENPEKKILEIFSACTEENKYNKRGPECKPDTRTNLTDRDEEIILDEILLPHFDMTDAGIVKCRKVESHYIQLLQSQARILDFLVDQRNAVINGAAGTGKTLIAIERAVQLAKDGAHSLFLCFNTMLKENVSERIKHRGCSDFVKVMTVSGLAMAKTGSYKNYDGLSEWIVKNFDSPELEHIIIDEGQDFGLKELDDAKVLQKLHEANEMHEDGSFYVFYDAHQLIQGDVLPDVIRDADCKMTLYVNCRNTKNISDCSVNGLTRGDDDDEKKRRRRFCRPKRDAVPGEPPKFFPDDDPVKVETFIDNGIKKAKQDGFSHEDMVVLTCKTLETTRHKPKLKASKTREGECEWGKTKVPVYSCRKFKGLEASIVFLVDVDRSIWEPDNEHQAPAGLMFYAGASRAKYELNVAIEMSLEDAAEVADILEGVDNRHKNRPYQKLEAILRKSITTAD